MAKPTRSTPSAPSHSEPARKLDNLIFVVNCNLQRLDGPVRGNKRIIDELEGVFRGAGWNVIKVIWGSDWDDLFARDKSGLLLKRMEECVDGDFQNFKAKDGAYLRKAVLRQVPGAARARQGHTDEQLGLLHRGGHDPAKVYNAYKQAVEHKGGPTVILAKTVKGYGLGSAQARNATHSEKKLADDGLALFVKRFDIPVPEQAAKDGAFYRPEQTAPEIAYMQAVAARSSAATCLSAAVPAIADRAPDFKAPTLDFFKNWTDGSKGRSISTTMGFVNLLNALMKDKSIGKWVVPIVPDEGRTFGLESSIKQVGIYAPEGQKYTPHDADMLLSATAKTRTARSSKKASPRPAPWPPSPPPAPLTPTTASLDSLLHVLLHVRLPAHRRHGLGLRRLARQGLPHGRHRRPHHHAR